MRKAIKGMIPSYDEGLEFIKPNLTRDTGCHCDNCTRYGGRYPQRTWDRALRCWDEKKSYWPPLVETQGPSGLAPFVYRPDDDASNKVGGSDRGGRVGPTRNPPSRQAKANAVERKERKRKRQSKEKDDAKRPRDYTDMGSDDESMSSDKGGYAGTYTAAPENQWGDFAPWFPTVPSMWHTGRV